MNKIYLMTVFATTAILTGCTTSSQVQEMIESSHRDSMTRADAHEASIDVLKKSAMTGLEKSKENSELLIELQTSIDESLVQLRTIKGYAEASKILSAANTVKVADLEEDLISNTERIDETMKRLQGIDKLYEEVMIGHYQQIVDSANAAIESLQNEGYSANTNAPVKIDKPIEIVAPSTAPAATAAAPVAVQDEPVK